MTRLAGDNPEQQARKLLEVLVGGTMRAENVALSVSELLMSVEPEGLAAVADELGAYLDDPLAQRRAMATAVLVRSGNPLKPLAERDPVALMGAVSSMPADQLPQSVVADLQSMVEAGTIDAMAGINEVARLSTDTENLFAWLASLVDPARELGFDQWGEAHELGMAALSGMHTIGLSDWPAGYGDYQLVPASPEVLTLGETLYHLEEEGCVKCHGEHGEGVEGFPRLAQSPWVLGDPRRSAAIVAHGLKGPLTMPDGQSFDAQMDPVQKGSLFSDADVAAILTYVRQSFGNYASAVTYEDVQRAPVPADGGSWNTVDLLQRFPFERERLLPGDVPKGPGVAHWHAPRGGMLAMLLSVLGLNALLGGLTYLANQSR